VLKIFALWAPVLGAFLFFSPPAHSQIAVNPAWSKLLHAPNTVAGEFLLDPSGTEHPERELAAFIKALDTAAIDSGDRHPLCRFPARALWLKENAPSLMLAKVVCPKWDLYRERVAATSAAVVFSSYYVNNPASSFGHTFLRLGKESAEGDAAPSLLDVGVSYGAITNGAGPIKYVIGGLTGAFFGSTTAIPYYYKVREYNDYETRDLWNYHLRLTPREVERLTAHAFELESAGFPYYFLSSNCSLFVLQMLEATRPGLELTRHLPFYVIPSDTLKALEKENLIERVSYRPSPRARFLFLREKLTADELELLDRVLADPAHPLPLADDRRALIYDAALAHRDFTYAKAILREEPKALGLKRPLLLARSQVPVKSGDPVVMPPQGSQPHQGHGSRRLGLAALPREQTLELRFAFHDLLDPSGGYPANTAMTVGKVKLRRTHENRWDVPEVQLLDITSLRPWDRYGWAPSWRMELGLKEIHQTDAYGINGAIGGAFKVAAVTFAVMAGGDAHYLAATPSRGRAALGPEALVLWELTPRLKAMTTWRARFAPWRERITRHAIRYSPTDTWSLEGNLETQEGPRGTQSGGALYYYF
jgi:hypothetical protein